MHTFHFVFILPYNNCRRFTLATHLAIYSWRQSVLTAEQLEQYHRSGFVNGGAVLEDATVETLQREVMRVIDDRDNAAVPQPVLLRDLGTEPSFPVWQIVNIWQASPAFNELIHNQKVLDMVAQLSGAKQLRVWHDQIQYKPK